MPRVSSISKLIVGLHALFVIEAVLLYWILPYSFGKAAVSLAPMLQNVIPAVVTLRVSGTKAAPRELLPLSNRIEGYNDQNLKEQTETFRTGGSGVIIDSSEGYVVTNNHVIENATDIDVGTSDGRHFSAQVVGRDSGSDLALLKIKADSLPSIRMGDSDTVRVGDIVVAVGNPYGLEGTATLGIVSALMRTDIGHDTFEDYLQIDAQTNPGNSGGALVSHKGELIGINTVVAGGRGRGFSIGFAVPVNMVRMISNEIRKHGHVTRGATGLVVATRSEAEVERDGGPNQGVVVTSVMANSPAVLQGIKPGDVVVQVANKPVRSAAEFMTREASVPLGGRIPMTVFSEGRKRRVVLRSAAVALEPTRVTLQEKLGSIAGLIVGDILPGNKLYGEVRGVQVLDVLPLSRARMAGLETGDVIISVDGSRTSSIAELSGRIELAGLQYRLDIIRNGSPRWLRMNR